MRYALLLVLPFLTTTPLLADPLLTSVFPMSCQRGQQVKVKLAGKEIGGATKLVFSDAEVTAEAVGDGTFLVRASANTRVHDCDVWCIAGGRLSNPRRFVISRQPCVVEQSGNDKPTAAGTIPLPGAVDGRLEAKAKLDWHQFDGNRGQSVTLICRSRTLDGSVEPTLSIFGPSGRELAHSSGQRREPVVTLTLPENGVYRIRVSDRAYRKTDESFYHLELLTEVRVLGCFPDMIQGGGKRDVALYGFGLAEPNAGWLSGSSTELTRSGFRVPTENIGTALAWREAIYPFPRVSFDLPANAAGFASAALADQPVIVEAEAKTESPNVFQTLKLPVLLNGRFDRRGDVDWFAFTAKKNESLRIDVYGDRLGQQVDLDATILDADGKTVITFPDAGAPKEAPVVLSAESLDVSAVWKAPADGDYHLVVRDLYGGSLAGADRSYVLSLREATPSFRVFALPPGDTTPAGLTVPRTGHASWRIFALRQDGFDGPIQVLLDAEDDAKKPSGIALGACWIGPDETSVMAILTATEDASLGPRFLRLRAEGHLGETVIQSPISVTTLLTGSSAKGRLVDRAAVAVSEQESLGVTLGSSMPTVKAGEKFNLTVRRTHLMGTLKAAAKIEFPELPTGMKSPAAVLKPNDEKTTVEFTIPPKLKPGRYSIAASVTATILPPSDAGAKPKEQRIQVWSNSVVIEVMQPEK